MLDKPIASQVLGLELDSTFLKGAAVSLARGKIRIDSLLELPLAQAANDIENVKPLYIPSSDNALDQFSEKYLVAATVPANDVLIRPLELKLKKEKDIDATLPFQVEPILPYPVEQAFLDRIFLSKDKDGTTLTVTAMRKDHLAKTLETWQSLGIEPEVLTAPPQALVHFANAFVPASPPLYLLHIGIGSSLCLLCDGGKLIASQAFNAGLESLAQSAAKGPAALEELQTIDFKDPDSIIGDWQTALEALKIDVTRTVYALNKQSKGREINEILVTGPGAAIDGLPELLCKSFGKTLTVIPEEKLPGIGLKELLSYAMPIGTALGALPNSRDQINFRQQEYAYPEPWKRLKQPLLLYFLLSLGVAAALYIFGNAYASYRQSELKQEYLNLLEVMNKPYTPFETEFYAKTKAAGNAEEGRIPVAELTNDDIEQRLNLLEKEIQATPQIFPLQPNVPLVSDVLAWISSHPNFVGQKGNADQQAQSLHLENFSYTMVKRPEPTKKQEKYQVKVELEFSSTTPKMAREFHDALIAPNDFVDPKSEIKWTSNRDRYKTSFYLKDRTQYPTQ